MWVKLRRGQKLMVCIPQEPWIRDSGAVECEVQSVFPCRNRDEKVLPITEIVLVPTLSSGVPGSPSGIRLLLEE